MDENPQKPLQNDLPTDPVKLLHAIFTFGPRYKPQEGERAVVELAVFVLKNRGHPDKDIAMLVEEVVAALYSYAETLKASGRTLGH